MILKKLRGRWRLFNGYCPECNSDASKVITCHVCLQGHLSYVEIDGKIQHNSYPPPPWIKRLWWDRFVAKLEKTHG